MTQLDNTIPQTVPDMMARAVAANPDAVAIHYEGTTTSFAGLDDRARRIAGGLKRLGVGAGDRVALWLPSCPAYLALYIACARLGAIAVAVNTRYRAVEVADIVGRSGAKVLAMWPGFRQIPFADILADIDTDALAALETVVLYGENDAAQAVSLPGKRIVDYDRFTASEPLADDEATPDTPCNIFATSGTTKAPKFVLHRQYAIAVHHTEAARNFGMTDPETVVFNPLPLCGVFGFSLAMTALAAGRPQILQAAFDADSAVRQAQQFRATHMCATDDMIHRMLEAAAEEVPFPSLRFSGYAAFNTALEDLADRAEARGVRLIGLWGMSEMLALVARRSDSAPPAERHKTAGQPISANIHARVRDTETGALLGPGAAGELEITGPSRMVCYFENPDATAAALTDDGYLRTGDLAVMEEDGGFEFLSRMGDVLRLGGFLVSPLEIESYLQTHPSINGAQVVEAASERGNRPVAFVTLEPGADFDADAIVAYCKQGLAAFKVPVRTVKLDAFPITESANGMKIQRAKLRSMAQEIAGG